jgi:phosphonate transport system substrate-binding protein
LPVCTLAVHPLHNRAKLVQAYQPLVDFLNPTLRGARLVLEASRDYAYFEEKYRARNPEFLLPNPWLTLQAMPLGYHVIAMTGEANDFKGIFVVHGTDTRIMTSNHLAQQLLGLTEDQMLGKAAIDPAWYFFREDGTSLPLEEYPSTGC